MLQHERTAHSIIGGRIKVIVNNASKLFRPWVDLTIYETYYETYLIFVQSISRPH